MIGGRVLVVDDDGSFCPLFQEALSWDGHSVECATSTSVFSQVRAFHPQIILLHLRMKDAYTGSITKDLRADPMTMQIPLIVVSADNYSHLSVAGIHIDDFVGIPFDRAALLATVDRWLAKGISLPPKTPPVVERSPD